MTKTIIWSAAIAAALCAVSCHKDNAPETSTSAATQPETVPIISEINANKLTGTYVNAGVNSPVILIAPGSGPTDRDGNNPQGVSAQTYKLLAEQLAEKGLSTVRVDKRGMFGSAEAGNPNDVSVEAYAQDYRDWVDTIKATTSQDCIYMLGHSEGALMVSAAAIDRTDICGLILVSGMGRSFGNILRSQLKANPANAPILESALASIDSLENGNPVDTGPLHPALKGLFAPQVQGYMMSLMRVNPADIAKIAEQPTLILQGDNDLQTSLEDANLLQAATQGQLVILETVNHVLKQAPTDRAGNFATYANPDLPIDNSVIDAITEFVAAQ